MKILVTDPIAEEAMHVLQTKHDVTFKDITGEELAREIPPYHALMVRSGTRVKREVIERGENLRVIGRAGIGVDNVDVRAATEKKIKVVNSPTGASHSVAELAVAHMFALARHLARADRTMREGAWAKKQLKGMELQGKTLGLIGSGNIAQETARIAKCLGMNVLVYSPHCTQEKARAMGAHLADIKELMSTSDFVSLHIPKTKESYHLLNEELLSLMKPTAYLVNCARGGVVDENALYTLLKNGGLAGAAIDVYETEPPGDTPLATLENVVLTPHLGASTAEGQIRAGTICAEQINKVLEGESPDFWVNPF